MGHDDMNRTDRRKFLQAGCSRDGRGRRALRRVYRRQQDRPRQSRAPQAKAGEDRRRGDDSRARGGATVRTASSAGFRQRHPPVRYRQGLRHRAALQEVVRAGPPRFASRSSLSPRTCREAPKDLLKMVDERLAALGTDYIDLFFVHGLGDGWKLDKTIDFITGKEFKETADAIRKSGKAKFIGFSCSSPGPRGVHPGRGRGGHRRRHHASVRAMARQGFAAQQGARRRVEERRGPHFDEADRQRKVRRQAEGQYPRRSQAQVPMLAERNLTVFQGLLHAIWTDERISASCVSMRNTDHQRENADAARRFEPLKTADIHQLRDAILAQGPTLCADCDGRCMVAAGTQAELGNITRFLTYHQGLGDSAHARREYAKLPPEARDWSGADLEAARQACPSRLNFAQLLPEAEKHLA